MNNLANKFLFKILSFKMNKFEKRGFEKNTTVYLPGIKWSSYRKGDIEIKISSSMISINKGNQYGALYYDGEYTEEQAFKENMKLALRA